MMTTLIMKRVTMLIDLQCGCPKHNLLSFATLALSKVSLACHQDGDDAACDDDDAE